MEQIELEIVRDLNRTYPGHVYFQQRQGPGQRSLFNVLKAYSVYDKKVREPCGSQKLTISQAHHRLAVLYCTILHRDSAIMYPVVYCS